MFRAGEAEAVLLPAKAQAILAYLAAHCPQPVTRERLADLGWPRSAPEQARQSLRQALVAIRQILPPGALLETVAADSIVLKGAETDLQAFESNAKADEQYPLELAVALYRGPLLAGFAPVSPSFDEWLTAERARLAALAGRAMNQLAETYVKAGDASAAIATAESFVAQDPLREDAQRLLIRCYALAGRRSDALRQYEQCRQMLKRELGVAPDAATTQLARSLIEDGKNSTPLLMEPQDNASQSIAMLLSRNEAALAESASSEIIAGKPLPPPRRKHRFYITAVICGLAVGAVTPPMLRWLQSTDPRVAVMVEQFTSVTGDPKSQNVATNVTRRLAAGFGSIRTLRIVEASGASPSGSRGFAAKTQPRWVISGTLLPGSEAWVADARMTDAATGEMLWSGHFVVPNEGSDGTQNEEQFAGLLGDSAASKMSELVSIFKNGSKRKPEVQALVDEANNSLRPANKERSELAEGFLQKALLIDPADTDLKIRIARNNIARILNNWYEADVMERKRAELLEFVNYAIQEQPDYFRSRMLNCEFLRTLERFADATVACGEVLALNPWYTFAIKELGYDLMFLAQFERALSEFRYADRIDRIHAIRWTWLEGAGRVCVLTGRNDEAIAWLKRAMAAGPGNGISAALLSAAIYRKGETQEAVKAMARFRARWPDARPQELFSAAETTSPEYQRARTELFATFADMGWN